MEKTQDSALSHLRKSLKNLGSSAEKCEDKTLMRFLIARSMDPEKASKMFVQWQKWRVELAPLGYIPDSEVIDELEGKKIFLQGLSKNGCPILLVKGSKHFPSKDQPQFKKFVAHILDKSIASSFKQGRETGDEKIVGILDLKDLSYNNLDTRGLISGFKCLQAYYPERLAKCYILYMPRFFLSVWRFVSTFLDKATLQKIAIVSSEKERRDFIEDIGEEALPREYGGRSQFIPIQDVVLPPMEPNNTNN